ncbi:MAG: nucleotidyltransferase domain-containing protein [Candidatus Thermoplasmatota archaeon]
MLRKYFSGKSNVLLAYFFGSSAKGKLGRDLDIALLVNEKELKDGTIAVQTRYKVELMKLMNRTDIDVVILNDAPLLLRHEVIKAKKPIFVRDEATRIDFESMSELKYYDFLPYRKMFWEALKKRIKEGRFID